MTRLALFAITVALLATGCSGGKNAARTQSPSTSAAELRDLHNVGQLRALFNTRSGEPRLILLASPT